MLSKASMFILSVVVVLAGTTAAQRARQCTGDFAADCAKIFACSPDGVPTFDTARVWNRVPLARTEVRCLDCSMALVNTLDVSYAEGDWPINCDTVCGSGSNNADFMQHAQDISQNCPYSVSAVDLAAALGLAPAPEAEASVATNMVPVATLVAPAGEAVAPVAEIVAPAPEAAAARTPPEAVVPLTDTSGSLPSVVVTGPAGNQP